MSSCDLFLDEHNGSCGNPAHLAAMANRAQGAHPWGEIERRVGAGDFRDHLDGVPIHCGQSLEVQTIEYRSDDYGEYTVRRDSGLLVRYEIAWMPEGKQPMLHLTTGGGYEFTKLLVLPSSMRFRWPKRR